MKRREYLERFGAGSSLAIVALAGCSSPGGGAETPAVGSPAMTGTTGETDTRDGTGTSPDTTGRTPQGTTDETTDGTVGTDDRNEVDTSPTETAGTDRPATPGADTPAEVAMLTDGGDQLFDPIGLHVQPGATVTWINESGAHSTTAYTEDNPQSTVRRIAANAEGWDSGIVSEQGGEFTHTFDVQGTYDYYCLPHKSLGMVARLVVGEPTGLNGDPPDGPVPSEQRIVDQGVVSQAAFNP